MKGRFNYQWAGVLLVGGVVAWFAYRWYRDRQRALAHPIVAPNPKQILSPITVDPSLVTDANIVT